MYRLKRNGHDSANFEMVFEEYGKVMEQGNSSDRRSKAAALRAFERLIGSFLISYDDPRSVLLFYLQGLHLPVQQLLQHLGAWCSAHSHLLEHWLQTLLRAEQLTCK